MEQKKKNDVKLIGGILIAALGLYVGTSFFHAAQSKSAYVFKTMVDPFIGKYSMLKVCSGVIKTNDVLYNVDTDTEEKIELPDGSYNILVIKEGKADVTEASCPDGICVSHRAVSKQNQSITCLPNKLVVEIKNGEASDLDAMTN